MPDLLSRAAQAPLMAAGMAWQVGWSLVFRFILSAVLQNLVSRETLNRPGANEPPEHPRRGHALRA